MSIKGPKVEPSLLDRVLNQAIPLHEELALVALMNTDLSVAEHNTIAKAVQVLKDPSRALQPPKSYDPEPTQKRRYTKHHPEAIRQMLCSTRTYDELAKTLGMTKCAFNMTAHMTITELGFRFRWQVIAAELARQKER